MNKPLGPDISQRRELVLALYKEDQWLRDIHHNQTFKLDIKRDAVIIFNQPHRFRIATQDEINLGENLL